MSGVNLENAYAETETDVALNEVADADEINDEL